MQIVTDHNNRNPWEGAIESGRRRSVGPEGVVEAAANDKVSPWAMSREQRDRVRGRPRGRNVDASSLARPLREVHVRVPQPRHEPPTVKIELVCSLGGLESAAHGGDAPFHNRDIHKTAVADYASAAQRQRIHAATLVPVKRQTGDQPPREGGPTE